MLIAQQRGTVSRPWLSLPPNWLGRLILVVVAVALVLGPLSFRDAVPHGDQDSDAALSTVGDSILHELFPSDTAASRGGVPATTPHSHCVIHCSLASLLFPALLLGALLLAARLLCFLPLGLQSLATPPLSPPPQPAR